MEGGRASEGRAGRSRARELRGVQDPPLQEAQRDGDAEGAAARDGLGQGDRAQDEAQREAPREACSLWERVHSKGSRRRLRTLSNPKPFQHHTPGRGAIHLGDLIVTLED